MQATTPAVAVEPIDDTSDYDAHDDLPTIRLSKDAEELAEAIDATDLELGNHHGALLLAEQVATMRDADLDMMSLRRVQKYAANHAEYVSANFDKKSTKTFLGIRLGKGHDKTIVEISSRGPVGDSPLQVGDTLWSVNGKHCANMMSKDVTRMLKNSMGSVTLVAHHPKGAPDLVESMMTKEHPDDVIGVGLQKVGPKVLISYINRGSDIGSSLLTIGDEVVAINGFPTEHLSLAEAKEIIRSAPKTVSVKAITLRSTGVVIGEDSESPVEDPATATRQQTQGARLQPANNHRQQQQNHQQRYDAPINSLDGTIKWALPWISGCIFILVGLIALILVTAFLSGQI